MYLMEIRDRAFHVRPHLDKVGEPWSSKRVLSFFCDVRATQLLWYMPCE
jgi:hypothetical protein